MTNERESVKNYYGKELQSSNDLKTNACCVEGGMPLSHRRIMGLIDDEILDKFYGCGSPIPTNIEGCSILDLGCGTGRDVYLLSKLVGENGFVTGVDMTDEQLDVAQRHVETQTKKFGYSKPNVKFIKGYIENLEEIEDNSCDVVTSNCVINLSTDKKAVLSEIFRVLKPGGELYFSDVFSGRRVPDDIKNDPVLYGECLGGVLYIEDFRRILKEVGCLDYRVISNRRIKLTNPEIINKAGMVDFYSITIRAFKMDDLEDICEDYGQVATYKGTIPESPHSFELDDHHEFITGKPMLVCGNTASMVSKTRFGKHFKVIGNRNTHYGTFDCSVGACSDSSSTNITGSCC